MAYGIRNMDMEYVCVTGGNEDDKDAIMRMMEEEEEAVMEEEEEAVILTIYVCIRIHICMYACVYV